MGGGGNPRRSNGWRRDQLRRRVLARGEPCWICGMPIDTSLPNLHPCQGVVDELVPVSRGGSPYEGANVAVAHRCCNSWRKTKPVAVVRQVQEVVARMGGAQTPQLWCVKAKQAQVLLARGEESAAMARPKTSTDW